MTLPVADQGAVVTGLAAGAGGVVLSLLGVTPPILTAALIGCVFGAAYAKPVNRWHGALLFVAAVCASAEAAAILGPVLDHMTDSVLPMLDAELSAKAVAMLTGALLHPMLGAAGDVVPAVVRGLARLMPGGRE